MYRVDLEINIYHLMTLDRYNTDGRCCCIYILKINSLHAGTFFYAFLSSGADPGFLESRF